MVVIMNKINVIFYGKSETKFNIAYVPGFVLFFMMLFVPTTYQNIKAVLLAVVLFIITIVSFKKNELALHRRVWMWTLFIVSVGAFFMLRGLLHNAPGAWRVGTVYILWPLVYTLLISALSEESILDKFLKLLVISLVAIAAYTFSFILYSAGWFPSWLYLPLEMGQAIGFYKGFIEYRLYNISSLVFLVPFVLAALMTWPEEICPRISRSWLWIASGLGMALVILSGRRALMLVVVLAPFITLFFRMFLPKDMRKGNREILLRTVFGTIFVFLLWLALLRIQYGISLFSIINMFLEGFDFSNSLSALLRKKQFFALLKDWTNYPLLGAGHGAAVAFRRSTDQAWAYELYYVSLLHKTGIVGIICYGSWVLWILGAGSRIIRYGQTLSFKILPVLVGCTCFLIANATNPYLGKYDYIWVLFLPIAFINCSLLQRKRGCLGIYE